MKSKGLLLLVSSCLLLLPAHQAGALLLSTFDSDAEGWGIYGNGSGAAPDYVSSGGNPGGFIKESDDVGDTWYFVSPSSWSGDLSAYISGTLSYEIIILSAYPSPWSYYDVVIYDGVPNASGTAYLTWTAGISPPVPPDEAWTSFSVEIIPENFTLHAPQGSEATFESVMAGVHSIHIRGEFAGASDTEGLDNARLQEVPQPVRPGFSDPVWSASPCSGGEGRRTFSMPRASTSSRDGGGT